MAVLKGKKAARFLISVNVVGSTGPIRFVVSDGEEVRAVIGMALKCYMREGRRPVMRGDVDGLILYTAGSEALSHSDVVSANGTRNFWLCKKDGMAISSASPVEQTVSTPITRKGGGSNWKSWINKSFSFRVASH